MYFARLFQPYYRSLNAPPVPRQITVVPTPDLAGKYAEMIPAKDNERYEVFRQLAAALG
jgi:hypothetical protein